MSKTKKLLSVLLCLCVLSAFTVVGVQAKTKKPTKKTVYVIATEDRLSDGEFIYFTKYVYNKKGGLKRQDEYEGKDGKLYHQTIIKYNKKGRVSSFYGKPILYGGSHVYTFKYNKKGKLTAKILVAGKDYKIKKRDKKGRVKTIKEYVTGTNTVEDTYTLAYNKKGHISKVKSSYGTTKYKYDKKGNLTSDMFENYKNIYKKGLLIKKTSGTNQVVYTYKRIKLSAKQAKKVKKQQWALINSSLNFPLNEDLLML